MLVIKDSQQFIFLGPISKGAREALKQLENGEPNADSLAKHFGKKWRSLLIPAITGGSELTDMLDVAMKTDTTAEAPEPSTKQRQYITDFTIDDLDTIIDIKNKIYVAVGVPPYRQHLYWTNGDRVSVPYELRDDNFILPVDIRTLELGKMLYDIPVDSNTYTRRSHLSVVSNDQFITKPADVIILTDLNDFITNPGMISQASAQELAMLYYGFVIKFWPQLTFSAFKKYLAGDRFENWPLMAPNYADIKGIIIRQQEMLAIESTEKLERVITHVKTSGDTDDMSLNLRNLFDEFRLNVDIVQMTFGCYVKHHITLITPFKSKYSDDIVFYIANDENYITMTLSKTGAFWIQSEWQKPIDLDAIGKRVKPIVLHTIGKINAMGFKVFPNAKRLRLDHIKHADITARFVWKHVLSSSMFGVVIKTITRLSNIDLFGRSMNVQKEQLDFMVTKGITEYEHMGNRGYSYMSDTIASERWGYTGRNAKIYHRTTEIVFEISGASVRDLDTFEHLTKIIIEEIKKTDAYKNKAHVDAPSMNLKKMQEVDPELFKIPGKGYSIACQKARQPRIYSQADYEQVPASQRSKLILHKNLTTGDKVYYSCPNANHPRLSYIVGVHPKNYCLPCCGSERTMHAEKRKNINKRCASSMIYVPENSDDVKHIIAEGKALKPGRRGKLPAHFGLDSMYALGVPDDNVMMNMVHAVAAIMDIPPSVISERMASVKPGTYQSLLQGQMPRYFHSIADFRDVVLKQPDNRVNLPQWIDILLEISVIHGFIIYVMKTETCIHINSLQQNVHNNRDSSGCRYGFIMRQNGSYYPAVGMILDHENPMVKRVSNAIAETPVLIDNTLIEQVVEANPTWKLGKFVGDKRAYCSARMVIMGKKLAYIPIDYIYVIDNISIDDAALLSDASTTMSFIQLVNAHIETKKLPYIPIRPMDVCTKYKDGVCTFLDTQGYLYFGPQPVVNAVPYTFKTLTSAIDKEPQPVVNSAAVYGIFIYRVFLLEFMNYVDQSKNAKARKIITDAVKKHGVKQPADVMKTLHDEFVLDDIGLLGVQINDTYSANGSDADFLDLVNNTIYVFDRQTIIDMAEAKNAHAALVKLIKLFAVEGSVDTKKPFPNIYLPCAYENSMYCKGKKLVIPSINKFASILLMDIRNPLKQKYMFSGILNTGIIDHTLFNQRPCEVIVYHGYSNRTTS